MFVDFNQALTSFKNEMEAQGLWDNVTVVLTSDFGRTLTANSGFGSDHAWVRILSLFDYWRLHEVSCLL